MRLLFITDFTEQFAYRLLQGILHYAEETEQWVVCKMPPAHKQKLGMQGVLDYAKRKGWDEITAKKWLSVAMKQDVKSQADGI